MGKKRKVFWNRGEDLGCLQGKGKLETERDEEDREESLKGLLLSIKWIPLGSSLKDTSKQ